MFGLLTRTRTRTRPTVRKGGARRSVRLALEQLETRDCPSVIIGGGGGDGGGSGGPTLILSASATNEGRLVELAGTLTDANPAGATVTFSGVCSGQTTTDANGNFDVFEMASSLGEVDAVAVDQAGQTSNTSNAGIFAVPPTISITQVVYGSQATRQVSISGNVQAASPSQLAVTFGGVVSGTVWTDANGNFNYITNASGPGDATVSTVDVWGQASNIASVALAGAQPSFQSFTVTEGTDGNWVLSGLITGDGDFSGCMVSFSGLGTDGQSTTVGTDGSFSLNVHLAPGQSGNIAASITTGWGLSASASYFVST